MVLGHVCRTEGEEGAASLLESSLFSAKTGGRILVADYFIDLEENLIHTEFDGYDNDVL